MKHTIRLLFLFYICSVTFEARAANLYFEQIHPNVLSISLEGTIQKGDNTKFENIINSFDGTVSVLKLHSLGGDVEESMNIARTVEALQIMTMVPKDKVCASACFFIFVAGTDRLASGIELKNHPNNTGGFVGVHRPYLINYDSDDYLVKQKKVIKMVREYLDKNLIPKRISEAMLNRPSNDIYWLTFDDLDELGPYSPALEELLISSCAYNRNLVKELTVAEKNNDIVLKKSISEKISKINSCIVKLRLANYEKMTVSH